MASDTFVIEQIVVDGHWRNACGRLASNKLPDTSVHTLDADVRATFDLHQARISTVLKNDGRKFCGRLDPHPYRMCKAL